MSNIRRHTIAGKEAAAAREAAALEILGAVAQGMDVAAYPGPDPKVNASYNNAEAKRLWAEGQAHTKDYGKMTAGDMDIVMADVAKLRGMGDTGAAYELESWAKLTQHKTITTSSGSMMQEIDRLGRIVSSAPSAMSADARYDAAKRAVAYSTAAGAHCGAIAASWQSAVAMMVMLLVLATLIHFLIRAVKWQRARRETKIDHISFGVSTGAKRPLVGEVLSVPSR